MPEKAYGLDRLGSRMERDSTAFQNSVLTTMERESPQDSFKTRMKKSRLLKRMKKSQQHPSSTSVYWPLQSKRDDSDEYFHKYCRIVLGSEGFVGFWEPSSALVGEVRPFYISETAKKATEFAIDEYNTWGADLVLKRILKVNAQSMAGLVYYITLEATRISGGEPILYEAKVFRSVKPSKGFELRIFRRAIFYSFQEDMESTHGGYTSEDYTESRRSLLADLESTRGYTSEDYTKSKRTSTQSQGLMSYTQFIEELKDDVLPVEAGQRYKEYKSEYISTQKRAFFKAHKDEEWLKDKYHPTNLQAVVQRRNEHARQAAKGFLLELQTGGLDPTCVFPSSPVLNVSVFSTMLKAHPISSHPRRIKVDIEQSHALVHKLDVEKGIEDNVLCCGGALEGIELLDTLISYLWCIHGLNYYGMIERNPCRGLRHVRPDEKNCAETEEIEESGAEWEKKLDLFWQERLRGEDPLEAMSSKEKIAATAVSGIKERDDEYQWKYGCGGGANDYTKGFHAVGFLRRYVKDTPPQYVMELTSSALEDLYFHNYMSDPDSPGGTPVMQQPQMKRKRKMYI
ncbi:hypothetical protein FNV43_RR25420 [Rhamnella rubrinervis]|uniref:Uncharacterized protein n=1 Tax=Rhamnella rubrinervis TaxID=2594499 RepID=A0A8K0DZY2_9ROSA|nr:hypothetical protein FNV43_RR25420 [Rhamnella rubrinervis]